MDELTVSELRRLIGVVADKLERDSMSISEIRKFLEIFDKLNAISIKKQNGIEVE